MKKKIASLLVATIMATSFVGCTSANVSTNNAVEQSYTVDLGVLRPVDENSTHYLEMVFVGVTANTEDFLIADDIQEKIEYIQSKNEEIAIDLTFNTTEPSHVKLTGELKDGKTYFYYNGYVTTLEGETMDYNKEVVCDFALEPEIFNFMLDD